MRGIILIMKLGETKNKMIQTKLSDAVEDYLKTIYDLSQTYGKATTNKIAEVLEVKPASVSGMIKRLAHFSPALVTYQKSRGVMLTPEGNRIALEIIRHHRLVELFLKETLGLSWDEVDREADKLEHVISPKIADRIAQVLGDPVTDPHGDPIPTRDLRMPEQGFVRLDRLRPRLHVIIRRVRDTHPELLRYLAEKGVVLDKRFLLAEYSGLDGNLTLMREDSEAAVVLGPGITSQIFVEIQAAK